MNKAKFLFLMLIVFAPILILLLSNADSDLVIAAIISFYNLSFIAFIFQFKKFQNHVLYIYYGYMVLTLIVPILYLILVYSNEEINYYFSYKSITSSDVISSNIIIFLFTVILSFFNYLLLKKRTISKTFVFQKYYITNSNKYIIVLALLVIAYLMKIYLVSVGVWFMYEKLNLKQFPFISYAMLLSNLDILVLFYFAFLKINKKLTKLYSNVMIFIIVFSGFFAILATSKEKVLMLLIPIILMILYSKRKTLSFIMIGVFFLGLASFFDYMMFVRNSQSQEIVKTTQEYFQEQKIKDNSIFEDRLFRRLEYQTVLARVVKINDIFPSTYKFDYSDNFIGLIPRFIWPDKPDIGLDMNRIGHELGLVHKNDFATALGITPLGVAYYEMGIVGICLLSMFTSIFLFLILLLFNERYWIGFLLSYMLTIALVRNGTFTNILPTLIKTFVIFYIVSLLLNKKFTDEIKLKLRKR